ncbi:MAG: NAD(P)H-hydrate dehydratase [Beijerinckiaceae bacterium]|nr:NAD(P)H-hydrate dehydratase [Beijerinckiaceae bacterium]
MVAADAAAASQGLGVDCLMLAAGRAVAEAACGRLERGARIAVLCGPGNNGGDGYVAARILAERGFPVGLYADAAPTKDGAAARAQAGWSGETSPFDPFDPGSHKFVIDALYGAGLSRPIDGPAAALIARLNASGVPILSVDVPSGLDGDTGAFDGPCVKADETVTFFRLKPGHLLLPGREMCGRVTLADIGLTDAHVEARGAALRRNGPHLWRHALPAIETDTHKYKRGHCLVVSGPELQTGASRLAAIAALGAGAGAVTLAGATDALRIHAAHVTAIMLREAETPADFAALLERPFRSVVIGPAAGAGEPTFERIEATLRAAVPIVIDADGLTSLIGRLETVRTRKDRDAPVVMTPHAGEFERVFYPVLSGDAVYSSLTKRLKKSKVEQARAAARITGAIIVLKGADTVIASPDGRAAINDNAGPQLATAGSGDVLAGLIGSHLAQGMPGFEAAASAVWLHGALGAAIGHGLTADRLAASVGPLEQFM